MEDLPHQALSLGAGDQRILTIFHHEKPEMISYGKGLTYTLILNR